MKECIQREYGPTPCFREVGERECSLDFCPVQEMMIKFPGAVPFALLHTHCVMSDTYGSQTDFEDGKREFMAAYVDSRLMVDSKT